MTEMKTKPVFSAERFTQWWVKTHAMATDDGHCIIGAVDRWYAKYGERYELSEKIVERYNHAMTLDNLPPGYFQEE